MSEASETSTYPATLDTWNTITDLEDLVEQSDVNKMKAAIESVQTELGTDPAGSVTDVKTRLAVSLADSGALAQDTSDPGGPVIGQLIYRTDTDQLRVYDGSAWDTIGPGGTTIVSVTSPSAVTTTSDITIEASKLYLVIFEFVTGTADGSLGMQFNNDTTGYAYHHQNFQFVTASTVVNEGDDSHSSIELTNGNEGSGTSFISGHMFIDTTIKDSRGAFVRGGLNGENASAAMYGQAFFGMWLDNTSATSYQFLTAGGMTLTGNIYTYEYGLTV